MFRSLHMKLNLIMLLLIVALMGVVGVFLVNNVSGFYLKHFYAQMESAFSDEALARDLRNATASDEPVVHLQEILDANAGRLGIDNSTRNYYILDGDTGDFLAGSDPEKGENLEITPNILEALSGKEGYASDVTAPYMDVALPLAAGDSSFILYIRDSRETVQSLNSELSKIVLEALIFGLAISVLLSFLLSKALIKPIERLTDGAREVARGDFSHEIEPASQDEIGVLTDTFNHMSRVLQETIDQVENERNKLDTLFLHLTDGVIAFSLDGVMIHSNPAARRMLNCSLDPLTHYEDVLGDVAPLAEVAALERPSFREVEYQVGERSLMLFLAPFRSESQGGIMVVIHDVTEQKRAEDLRREFVSNVSHELRTPLTNIRSYAETLADAGDSLPPEMRERFFGVILNETDRMTHIVQDLLMLSRFDSNRITLDYTRFPLLSLLEDARDAVLMDVRNHGHTMTLDVEADLPVISADRNRLSQVVLNILSNAIKYTPDGGMIQLTAGSHGPDVWIQVSDNGIGIPEQDRERIFERFYRVDKARSRDSGGTGLGLSIAQQIIQLHGGTITLPEHEGPGLTVRVTIPREGGGST